MDLVRSNLELRLPKGEVMRNALGSWSAVLKVVLLADLAAILPVANQAAWGVVPADVCAADARRVGAQAAERPS